MLHKVLLAAVVISRNEQEPETLARTEGPPATHGAPNQRCLSPSLIRDLAGSRSAMTYIRNPAPDV